MSGEFEVLSKPYVPVWRRSGTKQGRIAEALMAAASLSGFVLAWAPWRDPARLRTPISLQLARADPVAALLFLVMALVLAVMAVRLWRAERHGSALLMASEVAALWLLARTDPGSLEHLALFGAVALASAGWLVALAIDLEDAWLYAAAAAGIASVALTPGSLGLGERALVTSCLAGMNLMFFRHFA